MTFLIDTDIIIYSIKGNEIVRANIEKYKDYPISISVITYGELIFGARKSKSQARNIATIFRLREIFPVIPVDTAVIETFSEVKMKSQKTGKIVQDMDLMIAATALTYNMILVTNNVRHFEKVKGLRIMNWAQQ